MELSVICSEVVLNLQVTILKRVLVFFPVFYTSFLLWFDIGLEYFIRQQ